MSLFSNSYQSRERPDLEERPSFVFSVYCPGSLYEVIGTDSINKRPVRGMWSHTRRSCTVVFRRSEPWSIKPYSTFKTTTTNNTFQRLSFFSSDLFLSWRTELTVALSMCKTASSGCSMILSQMITWFNGLVLDLYSATCPKWWH
jgi:hypothetical protein